MRLTHLKLAGFKSFADATILQVHGQRIGVVGPNGCGKSNVMESVRWVLGESSAKEMRADAMDAVIFNGAATRKAVSRASVELIFDNSLGGLSGEWGQYGEISVKRVIEREKGSTYYINNTAVRRRDVADLFLGTGLGGRAYAIIGQNTISRIVEAKPEELRVFLEEAAGVSKYKERRRETELRLRDTRENLTRVEDICRELQTQIDKLESQAIVTKQYHALQAALKLAEGQLWWLKKRDASRDWEKTKSAVERVSTQLEAQVAALRKAENVVEEERQAFYQASEAINTAQAHYYEANATVSNLEHQVKQNTEARERMAAQLQQIQHALLRNAGAEADLKRALTDKTQALAVATEQEAQAKASLEQIKSNLEALAQTFKQAEEAAKNSQQALLNAEQRVRIEENNGRHLTQAMEDSQRQLSRLTADLSQITVPEEKVLDENAATLNLTQQQLAQVEVHLQQLREEESGAQQQIQMVREALQQAQRESHLLEAETQSLLKIQKNLENAGDLSAWLKSQNAEAAGRLWQKIQVEPAWQVALEAVLGARLNALLLDSLPNVRPPQGIAVALAAKPMSAEKRQNKHTLTPLLSVVQCDEPSLQGVLQDWLGGVYVALNEEVQPTMLTQLQAGEMLVSVQGDIFTAHSVLYHGENSALHGVLERQQRLTQLIQALPEQQQRVQAEQQKLTQAEHHLHALHLKVQQESQQQRQLVQQQHQQQLALSKLQQQQQSALAHRKNIERDMQLTQEKIAQLQQNQQQKTEELQQITQQLGALAQTKERDVAAKTTAEQAYHQRRDEINNAERKLQELSFDLKLISNNISELSSKLNVNGDEKNSLNLRLQETESTLALTPMETLKANLAKAIDEQQQQEQLLIAARNALATQEQALKNAEQLRLQHEQALHPMRDALEQSRLSEQEARLYFEQCQQGLAENGMDEASLIQGLGEDTKTSTLHQKNNQLQRDIAQLGAVNLAAIDELAQEVERKQYLDSQMLDLTEASATLEAAIQKIDRETKGKLQATFDEANKHFMELFGTLFNGGQARLELLGEDILDTGLQVFAQPPGKRNTTIHLLSGGEKTLTALALVFALFKLNPSPFCLMDEVDAPLDDSNTERFCALVKKMSEKTQFLYVSHNKITMEMAQQLVGVTMQESGVSRIVDVDMAAAVKMMENAAVNA